MEKTGTFSLRLIGSVRTLHLQILTYWAPALKEASIPEYTPRWTSEAVQMPQLDWQVSLNVWTFQLRLQMLG